MTEAALVTGGSSGIGLAIAHMLAKRGYDVSILGKSAQRVEAALAGLRLDGREHAGHVADVAHEGGVSGALREHAARFGRLDVLVNAAGVLGAGSIDRYPTELVDELLAVNIRAPILFYRESLELLRRAGAEHGRALVVNVSSISGKRGDANFGVYAATKFALVGFTQSMRAELGGAGISSCALCPGLVDTEMASWARGWARPDMMLRPEDVAAEVEKLLGRRPPDVPAELVIDAPWPSRAD